jgi:hypothetical protein
MQPFKQYLETFEDPFAAASNVDRREKGEPDFEGNQMPIAKERGDISIQMLIEAIDNLCKSGGPSMLFRFTDQNYNPLIATIDVNLPGIYIEPKQKNSMMEERLTGNFLILELRAMQRRLHKRFWIYDMNLQTRYDITAIKGTCLIVVAPMEV